MNLTPEQYIEQLSAELGKLGGMLPLGFEYIRLTGQTPHPGGVDYMGQTATRAMYADLWAWLNKHKPDAIVSEEEWQALYASQNGNVGKFSTGDGVITFRFPRVVGYFKGAGAVSEVGKYVQEGLPNITGRFATDIPSNHSNTAFGAFQGITLPENANYGDSNVNTTTTGITYGYDCDASRSNTIYGASPHVTPETVTVVMGVIAFGSVASLGEATEEGIMAELVEHSAKLGELESDVANAVPAGFVMPFAANSDPEGFLLCNGAEVSRTTYAALFAVVGTTYGEGDGSTTFNIPDMTDRFIQGSATAGTVKEAGAPNITGTSGVARYAQWANGYGYSGALYHVDANGLMDNGDNISYPLSHLAIDASRSSSVYGNSDTIQPPALTMRYYIKY